MILLCLAIWVSGQEIASDKLALSHYDKSIEDGKLAEVENDLLSYLIANPKDAKGFALMAKLRLQTEPAERGQITRAQGLDA